MAQQGNNDVAQAERLERLLGYLNDDPDNAVLALDCAEAALAANQPDKARAILAKLADEGRLDEAGQNLAGIAAMRSGDQAQAQAFFSRLLEVQPDDSALRFNLAWSRALGGEIEAAREVLDPQTIDRLPQAAALDLQLLHQQGEFDQAAETMRSYLDRHPDYPPLQAAASVLAMDIDDVELARACAGRADAHPDALATLGALDLGDGRHEEALKRFEQSVKERSVNPRAHLGLGLTKLALGNSHEALVHLDTGAQQFGDHLGSWIAAGWAYCLSGDRDAARERFETALALDDTFAEAHGSLASLDVLEGDTESAKRRMDVAIRLDRGSFSAGLAGVLLASAQGDPERARAILDAVASQPLTYDGRTLSQVLAGISL